jgi:hypothetical protein
VTGRLAFFLLLATLALGVASLVYGWQVTLSPEQVEAIGWREGMTDEEAVDADLAFYVNDQKMAGLVSDAVAREDAADAMLWLDMARHLNIPLAGGLEAAAMALQAREDSVETQFQDYLSGFIGGRGDTLAGLAGAISSDLTVYGDLRDIVLEGGKMMAGEAYSEFILGLSVVGLAATAGTMATGGGGILVKAGVSFVKFAKRAGHLTAGLTAQLLRLTDEAVDMPGFKAALRRIDLGDPAGSWKALSDYAAGVRGARVFDVLGKMEDIRAVTGTTEALRLLKRMERIEDIDDIHGLSKVAGKRTRGVIELTGKTSLRAVKTTAHVLQIAFEYVWPLVLWVGGLLAAIALRVSINGFRLMRLVMKLARPRGSSPRLTVH